MAQLISVKLSRFDNSPWGFRLQGGKDFGTPLVVQKVNGGSPAEAAGLRAGDAVIKVNNTEMFSLRHKDAQDVVVRAGNNFEVTVQRGGSTWKPSVTPISATLPTPKPSSPATHIIPVTKTSLAAKKQEGPLIGSGHNFSPKPFLNGNGEAPIKSIVNKQYNSPVGIYSEETIAETLSAQAEVLAGGVLGVNFKKNEKNYNAENSEVFKMVQEADKEPRTPEPAEPTIPSGVVTPTSAAGSGFAGLKHVSAPETKSQPTTPQTSLPPGQNICADCERLIVGVFIRIKEKNLHVECFKCSTCGTSLKNVGYYNINNKLYCDIHAKLVARQNPPAPGLVPVTVPANKAPAGTISAALAHAGATIPPLSPLSPSLNNHSSPLPFNSNRNNFAIVNDSHQRLRSENDNSGYTSTTIAPCLMTKKKDIANRHVDAKTFTSTLIIQTGNEVGSNNDNDLLPYNNIINNELGSELRIVHDNSVLEACELDLTDHTTTTEEPTTDLRPIAAQPFPTKKKVSSTNNIGGPKPFGGVSNTPSLSSPLNFNSTSNTLPRPQSESVTDSHHEEFDYYEVIQTRSESSLLPLSPPPQPSAKNKGLVWPPKKSIEEITYPTASPLYINPNPALQQKYQKCAKIRPDSGEQRCTEEFDSRRSCSEDRTWRQSQESMEYASCSGPHYRKVQLYDVTTQRESRCRETRPIQRPPSRPGSRESYRRSLTPTKITQPVPQPWTATVTTGTNLYQQAYQPPTPPAPPICETICERRQVSQKSVCCSGHICQCEQICKRDRTIEQQYHPPQYYCQVEVCPAPCVYRPVCSAEPPRKSCQRVEASRVAEEEPKSPVIETEVSFTLRRPSSALSDTKSVRGTGAESAHDVITKTVEKDVGPLHVKQTTIYDRSIEVVDPDDKNRDVTSTEARRSTHLDEEVEGISRRRDLAESAHLVTSAVETQQMIDMVKQDATRREKRKSTDTNATGYEEGAREIQIQRTFEQQDMESERRQSLREQVQVHQSLREQQIPDRRQQPQTLQERRLSAKFNQQDYSRQQQTNDTSCPKKHVQFVTDTETGVQPLPPTTIRNATPKRWQSEMCKALTTVPVRSYSPMIQAASSHNGDVIEECYTTETSCRNMGEERPTSPFVQALTIAPESRRANYCATVNARETVVEKTTTRKSIPEPQRAVSPFREALTTAPDSPYTPLGFYDQPNQTYDIPVTHETGYQGSEATTLGSGPRSDGYCPPAMILYTDERSREVVVKRERSSSRNTATPQPLPTPPPNYRLRDSSRSPARSRSQTPSSHQRSPMTASFQGLKKPDAIPSYQKNLVHVQKCNVDVQHHYSRSRSASPCHARPKSPAGEPPVVCTMQPQAPSMREEHPPQISVPRVTVDKKPYEVQESYAFHEEDGGCCARVLVKDDKGSRHFIYPENASKTGNYMEKEEEEEEMFERNARTGVVAYTRILDTNVRPCTDNSEVPPAPVQTESNRKSVYSVPKHNPTPQVTVVCPIGKSQSNRFPKTGVCVLPPGPPPPPPAPKTIVIERVDVTKKSSCGPLKSQFGSQSSISQSEQSAFRETKTSQKTATMVDSTSSYSKTAKGEIINNLINDKAFKPVCHSCNCEITRGPFITALGNIWCPDHFVCVNTQCRRPLQDIGFVEEKGNLYCEYCFEQFIAPPCNKCSNKIKGECLNAIGKHFHPECFNCSYCGKLFGNNPFFLEDGLPYCESDWNELFTTKCFACGFPVEAGDRWVEALSNNYHSQCFNCTMCKKNLEGQSFYAKGGRPFCKNHAR